MSKKILVQADGVDRILSAQEVIAWNRAFMEKLSQQTPWQSPFSVSGRAPRVSNLKIGSDFSNFEKMSALALYDDKDQRFRNVGRKDCHDLLPTSYSPSWFSLYYEEAFKAKSRRQKCAIRIKSPPYQAGLNDSRVLILGIPACEPGDLNAGWVTSTTLDRILLLFRDAFVHCISIKITTLNLIKAGLEGNLNFSSAAYERDNPDIAPITYFGNPRVVEILKGEPDMQPYGEGLLLRLTDDIVGAEQRLDIVQRLHAISMKLRNAGIRFLEDGINRADWGCDSSSVLQGEPEVWPEHRRD